MTAEERCARYVAGEPCRARDPACPETWCAPCRRRLAAIHAAEAERRGVSRPVRLSACGTRAVERHGPGDFRVTCATCGAGGSVRHLTRESASRAAVRDSARPCRACGAH